MTLLEQLAAARRRGDELRALTEQMNRLLDEVERVFISLNTGVKAEVPLAVLQDGDAIATLSFCKHDSVWGLWVAETLGATITAAAKTSRRTRVRVAHALPQLLDELLAEAEAEAALVARANERLELLRRDLDR